MKIRPEDLTEQNGFRHIITMKHSNMLPFVFQYMKTKTSLNFFFWMFNLGLIGYAIFSWIAQWIHGNMDWAASVLYSFTGILVFLLIIIPLHELIHLAGMRILGAGKLHISANLRQGMFYACADGFVMSRNEFFFVALLPFLLINLVLLYLIFSLNGVMVTGLWWIFLFHSTGCVGDFALMSFYMVNRDKEILTYDDVKVGRSVFYERVKGQVK